MSTHTDGNVAATEDDPPIPRVAITPEEFGARFGKSQTWAYRQIYAGKIKVIPGCRPRLIPLSEIDRFLATAKRHK
jgi:hypothetical protein